MPEGPGINDDGSGTSTDLEVALQMAKTKTTNHVRFLWFGAEEAGLLGSIHYVGSLTNQQQHDIMAMLDFDMLASNNFVRFVYDGDGSSTGIKGPSGSGTIEEVFNSFWDSRAGHRPDRVRRPFGLRLVHRGGHPSGRHLRRRGSRPPSRRSSTAAPPVSRTTSATTSRATR